MPKSTDINLEIVKKYCEKINDHNQGIINAAAEFIKKIYKKK